MIMNNKAKRMTVNIADIMLVTGRGKSTASRWMMAIRKHYNKSKNALVTIKQLCEFKELDEDEVRKILD